MKKFVSNLLFVIQYGSLISFFGTGMSTVNTDKYNITIMILCMGFFITVYLVTKKIREKIDEN